jgi:hypothetical protein
VQRGGLRFSKQKCVALFLRLYYRKNMTAAIALPRPFHLGVATLERRPSGNSTSIRTSAAYTPSPVGLRLLQERWRGVSRAGSVARQVMGTTVIGGMLAASAIGIFFVPAIYYLVEKLSSARGGVGRAAPMLPSAQPGD